MVGRVNGTYVGKQIQGMVLCELWRGEPGHQVINRQAGRQWGRARKVGWGEGSWGRVVEPPHVWYIHRSNCK